MTERRRVSSGSPYESQIGFSRAVRVGSHIHVAGTAPVFPDGAPPPADPYLQTKRCLAIIGEALAELGAGLEQVVRTRIYAVRREDVVAIGRAHAEAFGEVRPAATFVVAGLLDPRWAVEIEADAIVDREA